MSSIVIKPEEKFCDYLDEVMVIGFEEAEAYFIIQRDNEDSEDFYIELNDQGQGCYSGLDSIIVKDNAIIFKLNPKGQEFLDTEMIEIFDNIVNNPDYDKFIKEIEIINRCLKK